MKTLPNFADIWIGREDREDGELGYRWHQVIQPIDSKTDDIKIALLGFESDLGVSFNKGRIGAKAGPNTIRNALANLPWHFDFTALDAGNIQCDQDLNASQSEYADSGSALLMENLFMIGLGGGHEIGWASFQAGQKFIDNLDPGKTLGVLNFDAHFDLRKPAPNTSSGTPFRQVADYCEEQGQPFKYACLGIADTANTKALFKFADEKEVSYLKDIDCNQENAINLLEQFLKDVDYLYVTICLDALPASVAPGVSAPSPLGINLDFVIKTLHWIGKNQTKSNFDWLLADIAELNPKYDLDNRTAKVAARLVHEIVASKFN